MIALLEAQLDSIKHAKLFQDLELEQVQNICEEAIRKVASKGDFVFFQGEKANNAYFLLEGHIKLSLSNKQGDQISVQHITPGESFAMIGVFRKSKYPVNAQAIDDVEMLSWDTEKFKKMCDEIPQLSLNCASVLAERSMSFQNRILELSSEKVECRIAHALLRLSLQMGEKEQGHISIPLKLTRQDIAELSGTTLFTSSRTLSKWQNEKIIHFSRKKILIIDLHKLVELAEDLPENYKSLFSDKP